MVGVNIRADRVSRGRLTVSAPLTGQSVVSLTRSWGRHRAMANSRAAAASATVRRAASAPSEVEPEAAVGPGSRVGHVQAIVTIGSV